MPQILTQNAGRGMWNPYYYYHYYQWSVTSKPKKVKWRQIRLRETPSMFLSVLIDGFSFQRAWKKEIESIIGSHYYWSTHPAVFLDGKMFTAVNDITVHFDFVGNALVIRVHQHSWHVCAHWLSSRLGFPGLGRLRAIIVVKVCISDIDRCALSLVTRIVSLTKQCRELRWTEIT